MFDYQAPANLLKDRIILITGAGSGIGRAAALSCAAHGATVILLGRNEDNLNAVYDEIEAAGYPQPGLVPLDLATATGDQFAELSDMLGETFGRLDGLLHNASILGDKRPLVDVRSSVWNEVMQVNVTAAFLLTKALMPLLLASDDASIVFTSSGVGRRGRAYWGAYAVSKFATEGMMQVLADELSGTTHVRVNSLNPGATNTAMRRSAYPAEEPSCNPSPEDIMPAYLYLLGPASKGQTGQAFDAQ